jgi:hypothetical protein
MNTTLQIAIFRSKMVARSNVRRAVEILLAAGVALTVAVKFLASLA